MKKPSFGTLKAVETSLPIPRFIQDQQEALFAFHKKPLCYKQCKSYLGRKSPPKTSVQFKDKKMRGSITGNDLKPVNFL